ncbi:MAG: RNA polymerase sigma factor RpoD/SigA [Candidatus Dadabacteria bacterium]|nr:MAG: RNA polymerase sigma factor RpoD/SigA [Candidatus Dadabacteria bacterium]
MYMGTELSALTQITPNRESPEALPDLHIVRPPELSEKPSENIPSAQSGRVERNAMGIYLRDINRYPLISREREVVLAERIARGDKEALDELVNANLRFVVSVAKKVPGPLDLEDKIQAGNMGLIKAAERFDASRGYRFITYAVWWIRQSINREMAQHGRTVYLPVNKQVERKKLIQAITNLQDDLRREPSLSEVLDFLYLKETEKVEKKLTEKLGRKPSEEELLKGVAELSKGINEEKVMSLLSLDQEPLSLEEPLSADGKSMLGNVLPDKSREDLLSAIENQDRDDGVIEALNTYRQISPEHERRARIIELYYGLNGENAHTLSEIGRDYLDGLSRERVRQLRNAALNDLRAMPAIKRLAVYCEK